MFRGKPLAQLRQQPFRSQPFQSVLDVCDLHLTRPQVVPETLSMSSGKACAAAGEKPDVKHVRDFQEPAKQKGFEF